MTYPIPRPFDVDEIRTALADGDDAVLVLNPESINETRRRAADNSQSVLRNATGERLLASEQRRFDAFKDVIETCDRASAVHTRVILDDLARREERIEESAAARRAAGVGVNSRPTLPGSSDVGRDLRAAIAEVREGRASAVVEIPETRQLTVGGTGGGAVPLQIKSPVMTMRARSVVMSLPGIRIERMTSDRVRWPRFAQATVDTSAEAATLPSADTDIDYVDVVAAKYATYELLSTELEEDLPDAALAAIGDNLLRSLATKVDAGLLEGDGSGPGIVGLRNVSGINSTSLAGVPDNFDEFSEPNTTPRRQRRTGRVGAAPAHVEDPVADQDRHHGAAQDATMCGGSRFEVSRCLD